MAKLYFRYGAMNSGKSTQMLQVAYNYEERHQCVLVWKPSTDGTDYISPRIGLRRKVDQILTLEDNLLQIVRETSDFIDCILIDEAQFLTQAQVWQLTDIVDLLNIPVLCYGIRVDAFGMWFPGAAQLMALADSIEELKTICWCGRKAVMNARIEDGHVVKTGEQISVGYHQYNSLCRLHWKQDRLQQ